MSKVVKGKTDLWTTSPNIAKLLKNPDDGYNLSLQSHKKTDFICPKCNNIIRNKIVRVVTNYGLKCPICTDGLSYGEKIVYSLLSYLDIDFKHDSSMIWSKNCRYDFIIKKEFIIIEVHGSQHYEESGFSVYGGRTLKQEKDNDKFKRNLAIKNGFIHYYEIDARKSDFDYIKESIYKSGLLNVLSNNTIDWNNIYNKSLNSLALDIYNIWNNGCKDIYKISEILSLHITTVRDYLKIGSKYGLCDYKSKKSKRVICVDTGKIYNSLNDVILDGFNISQVSECCNNKAKTAGGYNWCFYDNYNPETYIIKKPSMNNSIKKVLCIETGKMYEKLSLVKEDNFSPSAVSQVCNGKLKKHKNCHFRYVA